MSQVVDTEKLELKEFWKVGEYEAFLPFIVTVDMNVRNIDSRRIYLIYLKRHLALNNIRFIWHQLFPTVD